MGWIGVDLGGTLAEYDAWRGEAHIGKPIPEMVERVRTWLNLGRDVRIFTARVCSTNITRRGAEAAIKAWCLEQFGCVLPVTAEKDHHMSEMWDDRAVRVEFNTGRMCPTRPE
jgi:hypothetical protein